MTEHRPERSAPGAWSPPSSSASAAHDLFADVIPDLAARAAEFRVNCDMLDDRIYAFFVEDLKRMVEAMETACAGTDEQALRRRGHSLEGLGGTMGLPELSVVGVEVSRAARERDWGRCGIVIGRLRRWQDVSR